MAGRGPAPKPSHLRQRTNKKAGRADLPLPPETDARVEDGVPPIPNPDGRKWHVLTIKAWEHAWKSPMASQWLKTDEDALGRLALLWDNFYQAPGAGIMAEIRLQESRFGLSPLDRSRLQWEVTRVEDLEKKRQPAAAPAAKKRGGSDPRGILMAVRK